jgi:hypothetical protein
MVVVLLVASALMFVRSRREPINSANVNDDWPEPSSVLAPGEPVAV